MKRILDLIRTDVITMRGGKKSTVLTFSFMIFYVICGFFVPLAGFIVPLLWSFSAVQFIFRNEMKYRSDKMYAILPVARRDVVTARFIFVIGTQLAVSVIIYILMLISFKADLLVRLGVQDAEKMNIVKLAVKKSGGLFTELGFFNLIFFAISSFGLMMSGKNLRDYFGNNEKLSAAVRGETGNITKASKREVFAGLLIFAAVILFGLVMTGIIPLGTAFTVVGQLIAALAMAANGVMLSAVLIVTAVMSIGYSYISTVLEFNDKEL